MIDQLGRALESADAAAAVDTLADDVVLRVAVHAEPFVGRPAAAQILGVVLDGVLSGIDATETIRGDDVEMLLFRARVAGYEGEADGLLVARRAGDKGPVAELTVFLRPLDALQALADEMGRRLGGPRPGETR